MQVKNAKTRKSSMMNPLEKFLLSIKLSHKNNPITYFIY